MPTTYDPNTPAIAQNDDWSCAVTSLRWALYALGRSPTEAWIEATTLAEGVESKVLGLMDATGAGLAAFLVEQYGDDGFTAANRSPVSFDDVRRVAGLSPVLIGGSDWCHWTGVRNYSQSDDTLALANPADHYMNVGQTLNRQQFAALGPFAMVVIHGPEPVPTPPPAPAPPSPELVDLRNRLGYLSHDVAAALMKEANTIESSLGALRAAIATLARGGAS